MSILNVWVNASSALVGVDTYCGNVVGKTAERSKLCLLPHLGAAISCRGYHAFTAMVFTSCHLTDGDFDALAEQISKILASLFKNFVSDLSIFGITAGLTDAWPIDRQQVVAVGWSNKLGRMCAHEWIQEDRAIGFVEKQNIPGTGAPWHATLMHIPFSPGTTSAMIDIARIQMAMLNKEFPGHGSGGVSSSLK